MSPELDMPILKEVEKKLNELEKKISLLEKKKGQIHTIGTVPELSEKFRQKIETAS